jgi:LPS export ABC transporter protein LptC
MRILFLLVPAAVVVIALAFSWRMQDPGQAPAVRAEEPPRYAITDVTWLRLGSDGEPEFRAQAESLDYFADDSVALHVVRLDALGGLRSPWHVEAPRGSAPPRERKLRLYGGVRASGELANENVALETPRLWVDLLRRELYTDAEVAFQSDFRSATARGLRTDFDGDHVQLLNDVRVDYVPQR